MCTVKLLNTILPCPYPQDYRLVKVTEITWLVSAFKYGKYIFHILAAVLVLNLESV